MLGSTGLISGKWPTKVALLGWGTKQKLPDPQFESSDFVIVLNFCFLVIWGVLCFQLQVSMCFAVLHLLVF